MGSGEQAAVPSWWPFWGKAHQQGSTPWHPVALHCLDVAAAGKAFLELNPAILSRIARLARLNDPQALQLIILALALHDLGKFACSFQGLVPHLFQQLHPGKTLKPYDRRHDVLGWALWQHELGEELIDAGLLVPTFGSGPADSMESREVLDPWFAAATGHHGVPPELRDELDPASLYGRTFRDAARAFALDMVQLFGPVHLHWPDRRAAREAMCASSWLVAGVAVVADWIGSNPGWFPYRLEPIDPGSYFQQACAQAGTAIHDAGLVPHPVHPTGGMARLFPTISAPSPAQRMAETLPLPGGPTLLILEDVTGSGKTEAAVTSAHRVMALDGASGMYVALPTMATANGMHQRMKAVYCRLFADGQTPSLKLVHSKERLVRRLFRSRDGKAEEDALAHCTAWLNDGRKQSLLAHVGVGTVDQALLCILPSHHNCLRLLGLHQHVLVVDEVHAYDDYTQRLLERLLEFHARLGGSAILLSATLPASMRQSLVHAFHQGLGSSPPVLESSAYPLVTLTSRAGKLEQPVAVRPGCARSVGVQWLHDPGACVETLVAAANSNGCAVWIRNSVADAMEAYDSVVQQLGAERVTLFHARFMLDDRLRIEADVLNRFGPASGPTDRSGRVVIATQVVEQSLDLDFDVLISDLAPVDLLIQRAGRLHRHPRNAAGQRVGSDERTPPVMHVHAPTWTEQPRSNWVSSALKRTALVYPDHAKLWLTVEVLRELGTIRTPQDSRALVEGVYGVDGAARVPDGLQGSAVKAEGKEMADRSQASFNVLDFEWGYSRGLRNTWMDDGISPTRLGDPTSVLRLARMDGPRVVPLSPASSDWSLSEVSVRATLVKERADKNCEQAVLAAEELMPDGGRYGLTVVMEPQDGLWVGRALNEKGRRVTLTYSPVRGLHITTEDG